jgi:hypothetical protein
MQSRYLPSSPDQDRQFDFPLLTHGDWKSFPGFLPELANYATDFIQFYWPENVNPAHYDIVVETTVSRGGYYRKIGPLASRVKLPMVQFPANGNLLVLPRYDKSRPAFRAELHRGSTYIIPHVVGNGVYEMVQNGAY